MVKGKDVWGTWLQRDMEERQIGNRTVYTFSKMKNSFYEMLCDTATGIVSIHIRSSWKWLTNWQLI